jgi:hypothetical protein
MLLLLSGGKLGIIFYGVPLGFNSGHLVNFFLGYTSPWAIGSTLSASPTSITALPATSATLETGDVTGLMGWVFCLLEALVINIEPHHSVKLLELLAVNHYCAFDRGIGWISDPALKVMDFRDLLESSHFTWTEQHGDCADPHRQCST